MTVGRILENDIYKGSGFALATSPSRTTRVVLTAKHVIGDQEPSSLQFFTEDKRRIPVERVDWNNDLDVAVLYLSEDVAGRLVAGRAVEGRSWETETQPRPNDPKLYGTITDIHRRFVKHDGGRELYVLQLYEEQNLWDYKGYSGSPVMLKSSTGVVIGILIEQLPSRLSVPTSQPRPSTNVLYAIPIQDVLDWLAGLGLDLHPSDQCPYRHLEAFTRNDADFFFGRKRELDKLVEGLRYEPQFLAVLGSSGSGKSSLVQAGLLPLLEKGDVSGSHLWEIILTRPTNSAFKNVVDLLSEKLQDKKQQHIGLIIDQFEELFTVYPEEKYQEIADGLIQLLKSTGRIHLILTLRNDFYRHFTELKGFEKWLRRGIVNVSATLQRDEVKDMIQRPAEIARLRFEEDLVENIVNDILTIHPFPHFREREAPNTVLPLLEVALTQLWEGRDKDQGMLTRETYRNIGRVGGALKQWADKVYDDLPERERELVRRIFIQLAEPKDDKGDETMSTRYSRQRKPKDDLIRATGDEQGMSELVIQKLISAHLLATPQGEDETSTKATVEIIHDTLLREWNKLEDWLDEASLFIKWHQKIEKRAQEWKESNTHNPKKPDKGRLLRGGELAEANDWLTKLKIERGLPQIGGEEQNFIKISRKRQRWEKNRLVAALGIVLAIVSVLASFAVVNYFQAEKELQIVRSQGLAAQAQNYMLKNQFDLALLFSVKAYQTNNNFVTRDTLLTTLENSSHINKILYKYTDFVFSSDSRTLLSSRPDGTITLWDLATGKSHSLLIPIQKGCQGMRLDPDGKRVVSLCPYGVGLWDLKTGRQLAKLLLKPINLYFEQRQILTFLTFSRDGHLLAVYDGNGNIIVWNLDSGKPSGSPLSAYDPSAANYMQAMPIAFSWDRKLLASSLCWNPPASFQCSGPNSLLGKREDQQIDQQIFIWDVASGKRISTFTSHQFGVMSLAFSPNGQLLATGGLNGTIALWNMQTKQPLGSPLVGHTGRVQSLAFSPDGKTLVSGGIDKTVRFWDVATQQNSGDPWLGHQGGVSAVLFSPDGQRLVSGGSDNTLIIWNLTLNSPLRQQVCSRIPGVGEGAFNDLDPSGHLLASGFYDGTLLCDISAGTYISLPTPRSVSNVAFSPDGRTLATYSDEAATLTLWDVATKKPLATLKNLDKSRVGPQFGPPSIMFSPDGRIILASYNEDTTLTLWDVATKKPPMIMTFKSVDTKSLPPKVMLSPDGHVVASYGNGTAITLWDTTTGQSIRQLRSYGTVEAMAFSSDGKVIASGGTDKAITLWDVATGERIGQSLRDHNSGIYPLVFIPKGRTLVSMSDDGTIILWETTEQKLLSSLPIRSIDLESTDYMEFPPDVELSPDGKLLAVASKDGSIIIWDMTSQELFTHPLRLFGPDLLLNPNQVNSIGQIRFGSNGQLVAMNYYGRQLAELKVTLWNINIALWIAHACSVVNRNLTQTEWEQFVRWEPYQPICPDLPS